MRLLFPLLAVFFITVAGCNQTGQDMSENPFFKEYITPFLVPPFDEIKEAHYLPAYKEAIAQQKQEIEAIVNNAEAPTFENTIVAMDKSGMLMNKIDYVFQNLTGAHTNEELQQIAKEVAPMQSANRDDIRFNHP